MKLSFCTYESPIGLIYVTVDEQGVKRVDLSEEEWISFKEKNEHIKEDIDMCKDVINQLDEYFKGKRKNFDLPLSIEGTDFRKKVWEALLKIPYGEVKNYGQIAETIGNPKAMRAVGQANRANQIPIIIPCHRVIGSKGDLVGYSGDKTHIKEVLLKLEGVNIKGR